MNITGYSGTPLVKKLGIKSGLIVRLINPPDDSQEFFTDWPENVTLSKDDQAENDVIHFFTKEANELTAILSGLVSKIKQNGMIWVSWPKKASKVPTDLTGDIVRNFALQTGLVDIKVCAVNEIWPGLKLVIRVKGRK